MARNGKELLMSIPRKQSEADIYHVYARGVGGQYLFEDDIDRSRFLGVLGELLGDHEGWLYAWVLMGNHFHLLLRMPLESLSALMRDLQMRYARRFNMRHGREGTFFDGRFGSQPITSDEQLMACVRYIHRNPVKAGLSGTCDYKWSSYRSYVGEVAAVTDTELVLSMLGGTEPFIAFHESPDDGRFTFDDIDDSENAVPSPSKRGDEWAIERAAFLLGDAWRKDLPGLPISERNARLRLLKEEGLSVRQIARLTGIGRNIISRA